MSNVISHKNASNNWLNNDIKLPHNSGKNIKRNNYPIIDRNLSTREKYNNITQNKKNSVSDITKKLKYEKLRLLQKEQSDYLFNKLRRYRSDSTCPSCKGSK